MKLPIFGRAWLAVSHDACAALLKDHQNFARDPGNAGSKKQERILRFLPKTISILALNMLGHDDPAESGATRTAVSAQGGQQSGDCGQQVKAA